MSDDIPALADLLRQLDEKKVEIEALTGQINAMARASVERAKLHTRRVIKQGMEAFFGGVSINPYELDTEDAELWAFGYNLSKDNWDEMRR
jgi:hypothetical protein